ncbi:hypothetical protein HAX54_039010 [Datura stramonium]|uniref:Uncharacterized protein n=1 Tax=Datura stramonium TaxID=4076 RepID=A0ABS8VKJ6_DATST|nr:hypothetical protein [Datura stramonium]
MEVRREEGGDWFGGVPEIMVRGEVRRCLCGREEGDERRCRCCVRWENENEIWFRGIGMNRVAGRLIGSWVIKLD